VKEVKIFLIESGQELLIRRNYGQTSSMGINQHWTVVFSRL